MKNIQMFSILFFDCKNFNGDGGAICINDTVNKAVISLCSFLACYSSNDAGSIYSMCKTIIKCSLISKSKAHHNCGAVYANANNINLLSNDCSKSRSGSISFIGSETNVSSINESSCESWYQNSCFYLSSYYSNIKLSTFINNSDQDGCSFNIYISKSSVSYLNLFNISSSSNANYGLLLFGQGCDVSFNTCLFSHNNQPCIVSYYQKNNDIIVFENCMFNSKYNILSDCSSNNVQFVSSATFIVYTNYGSCIMQPKSVCRQNRYRMSNMPFVYILIIS